MLRFIGYKRRIQISRWWRFWFFFVISSPIIVFLRQHSISTHELILPSPPSNLSQFDKFCWLVDQRSSLEPSFHTYHNLTSRNEPIPYSYARWKSSPNMPRLLTPCEHAVYMHLLATLVEHVFQKYNILYMMMAATLLGSYTRHDILPWDDDVDLRVSIADRSRFQTVIKQELSSSNYSVVLIQLNNDRNYDKIFFSWCPKPGGFSWSFPFIDVFYHDENSTHVWLVGKPSACPLPLEQVFPLVLRPLGPLWLYGPREPMAHFESRSMKYIETGCFRFQFSHKYERLMFKEILYADCSKLEPFYPYVERKCTQTECIENLKLGDNTSIHTVTFVPAFRTFLYAETNQSYRPC